MSTIALDPQFAAAVEQGGYVPVRLARPFGAETPATLFKRLLDEPYAALLETLGQTLPGKALIGLAPLAVLRADGQRISVTREGETRHFEGDPISAVRTLLRELAPTPGAALPAEAGAIGYFGYDAVRHVEKLPALAGPGLPMPEVCFMIPGTLVAFDLPARRLELIRLVRPAAGETAEAAYDRAMASLQALDARLQAPPPAPAAGSASAPTFVPGMSAEEYGEKVLALKAHILAGDIFQVVLSQRFEVEAPPAPFAIYEALREINPSPYMFCLKLPEAMVTGASPELLFKLRGGTLTVRPIAGTRRRGQDAAEDAALESELRADAKELAEHVMLVDLGRNDVGRVAEIGSVKVVDSQVVERYSHVMHLVSSVEGRLPASKDAFDAFRATFPAGTLSGAPKVRAMSLIEAFEPTRRGLYGGALGFFGFNGESELAIAIRTAVTTGGRTYFQTGAGIVHDSDPAKEYQETLDKARALRAAITRAHAGQEV
ncbi:MAG: anthranilate synthase component I family protein [Candidatus Sericytochromatia bacterium]